MATFSAVTRQHILKALAEYDDRGKDAFLGVYGFQPSPASTLVHESRVYDAKAVLGVAHRYATGRVAMAEELEGGKVDPIAILRKHGFEIVGAPKASAAAPKRAPRTPRAAAPKAAPTRRPAPEDRPLAICPTCFTALPATGVCDECA
ncbi:hypothetical protein [Puerhibacterium puerhi]|uniref:hypothetical protein n=1 Tax=Puerhibacterium puerhi TaxID=2692623 RepID=UPI00135703E0|nr:hypothetical protein [Puerhibacterium puerhi]